MKTSLSLAVASLLLLACQIAVAQSVQLSYPIDRSVAQRNYSDQATITIAGQLLGNSSNVYDNQLYYRIATLNADGKSSR